MILELPARVPSSLPMTVEQIRAEIKQYFPDMTLGYDDGFGWVLGVPMARRDKDDKYDNRVDIDQMITPCHTTMKMMPRLLIGGCRVNSLTTISDWLRENTKAVEVEQLGLPLAA